MITASYYTTVIVLFSFNKPTIIHIHDNSHCVMHVMLYQFSICISLVVCCHFITSF